jgi:hypothetical protein
MSNWVQLGQDINGNTQGEETGRSLAVSGDGTTLAIGAQRFNNAKGQVRVYKIINSIWVQIGDSINGTQNDELLGRSVSLSKDGSILAIGSSGFSSNKGKVMIYEFIGTNWVQLGSDIVGIDTNNFGHSVSLSDNGKIIGIGSTQDGKAQVYNFVDPNWEQLGNDFDINGWSVSISGDGTILVTSDTGDDTKTGLVKIYIYNGTWTQLGGDLKGEQQYDEFGYSVSISTNGDYIVISAISNIVRKNSYFKVFKYNNSWQQIGQKITGDNYNFGYSVSISYDGKTVGIGSPLNEPNGERSGNAFIYNYDGINWNKSASFDGKVEADENGWAVSLSDDGKIFAFGAPFSGVNFGSSGQARVFKLKESKPINPSKPKKKRKLRTFIKYGQSCGVVYFVTCLRSGLYRIVKKTRNNAGKLVTQEVRILPTYNVAF